MSYQVKVIVAENGNSFVMSHKTAKLAKAYAADMLASGVKDAIYLGDRAKKSRESLMRSMGLVKVRGAVSGSVYWE